MAGKVPDTAAAWHAQRAQTLWTIIGGRCDEVYPPQMRWWWDNAGRVPRHLVVAQYVTSGGCIFRETGGDRQIGPGTLFLFAYGEPTAYGRPPDRAGWPGANETLVTDHIALTGAGLIEHWHLLRARRGPVIPLPGRCPFHATFRALIGDIPALARDPLASAQRVAGLVAAIGAAIEDAAGTGRPPVEQAIDALLADPCAPHNLKAIAESCGCSREHLCRVFAARLGQPPARWLRERRLARAVDLLRETDLPLAAIAATCGAGTVHALARWTHESHGHPPEKLRKRLRGRH